MIYNTWNTSIRKMYRLNRTTHRYFIESISKMPHIKISLMKRFINFTDKLSRSTKISARNIFNIMKNDCRSTTGRNLRMIMKYCDKFRMTELCAKEISSQFYMKIPEKEAWRISLVQELLDIRDKVSDGINWNVDETSFCIDYLCTT